MCRNVSECRAILALLTCANHKSGFVRSRVASHIDSVVESPGAQAALLANWQCLEKLFRAVGGFLNEGMHGCTRACTSHTLEDNGSSSWYLIYFVVNFSVMHSLISHLFHPHVISGAQEARTYGKRLVWNIKQLVGNASDFDRLISQLQPSLLQKKVRLEAAGW